MGMSTPTVAPRKTQLALALVTAVVAISFAAPFFRQAMPTPPLVSAGVRLVIASILLTPLAWRSSRQRRPSTPMVRLATLAGLFYGVHFGSWVWSLELTTVAASVTLVTATPLLLGGWAVLTKRDRPNRRLWLAIGLATVGVATIGGSDWRLSSGALLGDGLALLGAAAMAGYLLVGRRLGKALDVWVFSAIATGVGGVTLLTAAVALGQSPLPVSWAAFGFLVLAAVLPQLVGHTLLTWSLRHTKPSVVGMATVGEPVGATLLAWIWLGEGLTPWVGIGCLITLSAVSIAISAQSRRTGQ